MSVKPIDLQSNVAHLHEIAKAEQGRAAAAVDGQHTLEKNAEEEGKSIRKRLEENKHAEKTVIMKEERHDRHKKGKHLTAETEKDNNDKKKDQAKDETMGVIIDVKR